MPVLGADGRDFAELPGRRSANPLPPELEDAVQVSVRVVDVPPGPRTPHRHPHSCEVIYVAHGEGRIWEGDRSSPVTPGDLVVVEQGVAHATVCTSADGLRLICFFPRPDLPGNTEELDGPVRE